RPAGGRRSAAGRDQQGYEMRLARLRELSWREWAIAGAGAVAIVFVVMTLVWTGRHGWAIYRLNRGVGDTMCYEAAGRPWFRLDEHRQEVPLHHTSTSVQH